MMYEYPGCQWGYFELRCSTRSFRVLGELPQASGDLYDDPAHSDNERYNRQDYGQITLSARPGDKTDQSGTVQ
jgi:hypothetical protein